MRGCFIYKMRYGEIKKRDIANGPGVRVSLFVSGCRHRCPGCFNAEAWDFSYGAPFDSAAEEAVLSAAAPDYIAGLSLLGGEPFEPENRTGLLQLTERFRKRFLEKNIWCYTGFLFEDLIKEESARALLEQLDVLVDGKFIKEEKDISLLFRGSANQRILDVQQSLQSGEAVWLPGNWKRQMGSGDMDERIGQNE